MIDGVIIFATTWLLVRGKGEEKSCSILKANIVITVCHSDYPHQSSKIYAKDFQNFYLVVMERRQWKSFWKATFIFIL